MPYNQAMLTVIETPEFEKQAAAVWGDDEHRRFVDWIARQPLAGDVIPGAEGARKVRWAGSGRGKRGGSRVIYFALMDEGLVVLLAVYTKSRRTDLPRKSIRRSKHEAERHQH